MPEARLQVTDPQGRRVVRIDKGKFTIGRRSESDLRMLNVEVSREHAEIAHELDQWLVRDRGSRYGTFVNDEVVAERVLAHGDRIRLGRGGGAELLFLVDETGSAAGRATLSPVEALRQMAALLEGLRALASTHVLEDVLTLVLDAAIEITSAERGFIMLANSNRELEFTVARGQCRVTLPGKTFDTSHKIPEEVFKTGDTRYISDLRDGSQAHIHLGTVALGIRHVLCTPLRLVRYLEHDDAVPEQRRVGVLYLDSREKGTLPSPTTRTAVEALAAEAAVAIENARLYRETLEKARMEQELAIAAEIQQALLPTPHYSSISVEVAGTSKACRAVGGDFFEYVDLPAGDFGFALGDVAGKGLPAALLSTALQGIFAAHALFGAGPADTLTRINAALIRRSIQNRFATMFYGIVSSNGRLAYCNGGHNPPLVMRGGNVRRLETGGLILGLFPNASYEEETIALEPGDLLFVFSDGVSEAPSQSGEEFGDDRIESCLRTHQDLRPAAILEHVLDEVRQFTHGTVQRDDITAIVLRCVCVK